MTTFFVEGEEVPLLSGLRDLRYGDESDDGIGDLGLRPAQPWLEPSLAHHYLSPK
jgi:hypothetical protein